MTRFVEYEVDLHTSLAKQLWNGRHKTDAKTFIPGLLEFNQRMAKTADSQEMLDAKLLAEVQQKIDSARTDILDWQTDLEKLKGTLLPKNARSVGIDLKPETKQVRFSQECSRQLALLIAQFDDISCQAIVLERLRKDLGLDAATRPTEPTKRLSKTIKAIIYTPLNPVA